MAEKTRGQELAEQLLWENKNGGLSENSTIPPECGRLGRDGVLSGAAAGLPVV